MTSFFYFLYIYIFFKYTYKFFNFFFFLVECYGHILKLPSDLIKNPNNRGDQVKV
jgi:hypothetical protein